MRGECDYFFELYRSLYFKVKVIANRLHLPLFVDILLPEFFIILEGQV